MQRKKLQNVPARMPKVNVEPIYAVALVRKAGHYAQVTFRVMGNTVTDVSVGVEDIQDVVLGKMEDLLVKQANKEPLPDGY